MMIVLFAATGGTAPTREALSAAATVGQIGSIGATAFSSMTATGFLRVASRSDHAAAGLAI
jgi:hypothetical protein